jgi:anaerobic magnesium-protoporphyrin IX monomethyl ester cyclase
MSIKILLVYSPLPSFFIEETGVLYGMAPPLGLLYLASLIEQRGDTVAVLDFTAEPYDEHTLARHAKDADVVGVSMLSTSVHKTSTIVNFLKQEYPRIPLMIGGPHCTLFPEKSLQETKADICIQGEGEPSILPLLDSIEGGTVPSSVPGIYYRTQGKITQGRPTIFINDIDSLPFPARHLVKHYRYGRGYRPHAKGGEFTSLITSRGCPYTCSFCSRHSITMKHYRSRHVDNILEELHVIEDSGYQHVEFKDDCFPVNLKHARELFQGIIREKIDLRFYLTSSRVNISDPSLYRTMKKAGVVHMQFGLESGNQEILDFYHKQTRLDDIRKAVGQSCRAGFSTAGSFILGAPMETPRHFSATLSFAKSLPLDSVTFLPLRYMAGSDLWWEAVRQGKICEDEYLVDAGSERGLGHVTTHQLHEYCNKAQKSFYLRPGFLFHLVSLPLRTHDFRLIKSYISYFQGKRGS